MMRVLSAAQKHRFDEEGFLVVEDVLDPDLEVASVLAEYADVLDEVARGLCSAAVIGSTYADLPFPERLIRLCEESGRAFPQDSTSACLRPASVMTRPSMSARRYSGSWPVRGCSTLWRT